MSFAYFLSNRNEVLPDVADKALFFTDFEDFTQKIPLKLEGYILGKFESPILKKLIVDLRMHNEDRGLLPLYLTAPAHAEIIALTDGIISSFSQAQEQADAINLLLGGLQKISPSHDRDTFLLQYLYARENYILDPILNWQTADLYHYPLLTLLVENKEDVNKWISSLVNRKLLEKKNLIDRIRLCPFCSGGHLNYIDTCPNCKSIDIIETSFLHCFTCGNVAPQEDFLQQNKLICPRCQSVLRHIGSDYDRPVENFHCNQCNTNFIEPDVLADCLICKNQSLPDNLTVDNEFALAITNLGILTTRNNSIADIYAVLDNLNYVSARYFEYQLNWYIKLSERYSETYCCLIAIRIRKLAQIVEKFGRSTAHEILEACAERLRNLIRDTDISTRTSENLLWILTPQTPSEGADILISRIQKIAQDTKQADNSQLEFKIAFLSSKDFDKTRETAQTIMAKLSSEVGDE